MMQLIPLLRATDGEEEATEEGGPAEGGPQTYAEFCAAIFARIAERLGVPAFIVEGDGYRFSSEAVRRQAAESPHGRSEAEDPSP